MNPLTKWATVPVLVLTLLASPEALAQKGERLGPDGKRVVWSEPASVDSLGV